MVVCESASSLMAAAVAVEEELEFSEAGMMRLGRLVGKVACEVMVTEGLPLTVAVVAPSWVAEALVTVDSSAEEVLVALLMRRVEVGSHS